MWSTVPLLRLIIPFTAGILLANAAGGGISVIYDLLWMVAGLVIASGGFYGMLYSYRSRWMHGILINVFFFCCGLVFCSKQLDEREEMLRILPDGERIYLARLEETFEMRARSCRNRITCIAYRDSSGWMPFDAGVMLYTEPDSGLLLPEAGSYLLFSAQLSLLKGPANPGEFNYREYLARQGIYLSTYLKKGQWVTSKVPAGLNIHRFAENLRRQLLAGLEDHGIRGRHYGIASALLLGEDSHLDRDVRDVYARAGAMHILCVSGLHVGVIFLVMSYMLGFLKRSRPGKMIMPVLLMGGIWSYALVTGLAPPVIRASCMISFFIVGNTLGKNRNVFNTLAASALLMLMIHPLLLYDAGFQLSYAAVTGIISLQRPVDRLFYSRFILPGKIWSISAVSIAAQLGTLPVVLYYFHRFPLYGLLTNLVVIPLSSLIIYSGLIFFLMPAGTAAASAAAWVLNRLLGLMDGGVAFVESLPGGLIEDIYTDLTMALMIALILAGFSAYLLRRNNVLLITTLFVVLAFSVYRLQDNYMKERQTAFIVYAVKGHSACDIIEGRRHIFMADSLLLTSRQKIDYSVRPAWLERGLSDPDILLIPVSTAHITYQIPHSTSFRILLWQGRFPACHPPEERMSTDFLVLRGDCPFEPEQVFQWFDPGLVIIDASVPPWIDFPDGDERFWNVRKKGAFVSSECRVPSDDI
jgi:competence protein ComEC